MPRARRVLTLLVLVIATGVARADEVISLERLLLPPAVADRLHGSGVNSRSVAGGGGLMCLDVGSLQVNVSDRFSVHGGMGLAHHAALGSGVPTSGSAYEAGVTVNLTEGHGFVVSLDVTASRAKVDRANFADQSVFLAVHDQM